MVQTTVVPACVACGKKSGEIPLIELFYREKTFWICPQHLPVLIHDPKMLAGKLPGAERMDAASHHD